jgi:hypothetical protein
MLKFGLLVDLEALDRAGTSSKGADELRDTIKAGAYTRSLLSSLCRSKRCQKCG